MAHPRIRLGRGITRILRGTVGTSYEISIHADAPLFAQAVEGRLSNTSKEFDDGNGMLVNFGVSWDLYTDLTEGVPRRAMDKRNPTHGAESE